MIAADSVFSQARRSTRPPRTLKAPAREERPCDVKQAHN